MLSTKSLAIKIPNKNVQVVTLAIGLAALAGCTANYKEVYPQPEQTQPTSSPHTTSSEPVLEEVTLNWTPTINL